MPTGNFGDAYAGYRRQGDGPADRSGSPRRPTATTSSPVRLKHGDYRRGEAVATQSPAMDIQVASNFERLYFEACGRDPVATNEAFRVFSTTGALNIPPNVRTAIDELFRGVSVSEAGTARSMLSTLSRSGELVDPHTAVALAVSDAAAHDVGGAPLVTLSTAHAAKFPEAVAAATGVTPSAPRPCAALADRAERFDRLPADALAREKLCTGVRKTMSEAAIKGPRVHRLANGVTLVCDPAPGFETVALSVVAGRGARWEDGRPIGLVASLGAHGVQGSRLTRRARNRRGDRGSGRAAERRHRP